nr:hypothetical protein CFP56_08992 [Quercus suber]
MSHRQESSHPCRAAPGRRRNDVPPHVSRAPGRHGRGTATRSGNGARSRLATVLPCVLHMSAGPARYCQDASKPFHPLRATCVPRAVARVGNHWGSRNRPRVPPPGDLRQAPESWPAA